MFNDSVQWKINGFKTWVLFGKASFAQLQEEPPSAGPAQCPHHGDLAMPQVLEIPFGSPDIFLLGCSVPRWGGTRDPARSALFLQMHCVYPKSKQSWLTGTALLGTWTNSRPHCSRINQGKRLWGKKSCACVFLNCLAFHKTFRKLKPHSCRQRGWSETPQAGSSSSNKVPSRSCGSFVLSHVPFVNGLGTAAQDTQHKAK